MKLNFLSFVGASDQEINLGTVIKSVLMAYVFSAVLLAVFAIVLTYTNFPESSISAVVMGVSVVSILYAAKLATGRAKSRGWLIGSAAGLSYMLILYLISLIFAHRPVFDAHVLAILGVGLLAGAVGGIIGINLKRSEKKRR